MTVAVVTGASRGLGSEIAVALAEEGHRVIAVSRSGTALAHPNVRAIACDIGDSDAVAKLHTAIEAEEGVVQILVNAAGVFGPIALIKDSDPKQWLETIMIDAVAAYYTSRVFLAGMLDSKWGRIINLSSAASLHTPGKFNSAYATAKVALNQLTRHLAAEISGSGVTANVIHPGDVRTEMWADIKAKSVELGPDGDDYRAWVEWVDQTGGDPPQKAADLVLKLISDESAGVNGRFCWIDNPLQAPIESWDTPSESRPWV